MDDIGILLVAIAVGIIVEVLLHYISGRQLAKQLRKPEQKPTSESIVVNLSVDGMDQFEADMERAAEAMEQLVLASSGLTTGPVTINNYQLPVGETTCEEGKT